MPTFTPDEVSLAFIAAQPVINQQIKNLSVQVPDWMEGNLDIAPWPEDANSGEMEEISYRGSLPPMEKDFSKWRKVSGPKGCQPCELDNCGYNWTQFGGSGLDRKLVSLMTRDFRSPDFCLNQIASTFQFEMLFTQFVQNMQAQSRFFKAVNVGLNYMQQISKKYVVDSNGPQANPVNPYVYRNIGAARLSSLNIFLIEQIYARMRNRSDTIPYDQVNGAPLFACEASDELFSRLYRDDPGLRWDVRFSPEAGAMLNQYNFMSTIRNMFIPAAIQFAHRYNIVNGLPVEVLPFINGVPAEVGEYTDLNPAWHAATHEGVVFHGKSPFKVFVKSIPTSLGAGSSFGPQDSFMEAWKWFALATKDDPDKRWGFYHTSATIGLSSQYSGGVMEFLFERASGRLMFTTNPNPVCPEPAPTCNNAVPEVGCPCPLITSIQANPLAVNTYFFTFQTAITGTPRQAVHFALDNGGTVDGVLEAVSTDGKTASISFAAGLDGGVCAHVVSIACTTQCACSSIVRSAEDCRSSETNAVKLLLQQNICADAGDDILAYFGDCTTGMLTIAAVDEVTLTYTVGYATGYGPTDDPTGDGESDLNVGMICDRGGISKICVPPGTNPLCPACTATLTECVYPRERPV